MSSNQKSIRKPNSTTRLSIQLPPQANIFAGRELPILALGRLAVFVNRSQRLRTLVSFNCPRKLRAPVSPLPKRLQALRTISPIPRILCLPPSNSSSSTSSRLLLLLLLLLLLQVIHVMDNYIANPFRARY